MSGKITICKQAFSREKVFFIKIDKTHKIIERGGGTGPAIPQQPTLGCGANSREMKLKSLLEWRDFFY
jgi:hypothetical protein